MFSLYNQSLALLSDLYELTMASAYWKSQMAEDEAVFHLFFRKKPFEGSYAIAAGLESVIAYLQNFRFDLSDLDYLATLKGSEEVPLFEEPFLRYLEQLRFTCDVDAVREGEVVFPYEPLVRVKGPILEAQLIESALLTLVNYPTLIATKAARICSAAGEDQVLEFGLRRAPGIDGAMSATRASYIGGCHATSNTLAGKLLKIPVAGTHAHSWVMAFETEQEAFETYARAMPHNSLFLVDTYDSIQGVKRAIEVGKTLRSQNRPFLGIRLDSGDIAQLSQKARLLLDEAGFHQAKIVASNELNETLIAELKKKGAQVAVWGVGTHLVTGQTQAALDGVYKISAIKRRGASSWSDCLKLSEQQKKVSDPGILQVRRSIGKGGEFTKDLIYDERNTLSLPEGRDLLLPIFRAGSAVYTSPSLDEMRSYAAKQLQSFRGSEMPYPVEMEATLEKNKQALIEVARCNR